MKGTAPRPASRAAARAVAGLLAADGLLHLYWTTGATWPAHDPRTLSIAVLGSEVPFTPPVLLPLVAVLLTGAAAVLAYGQGLGGRRSRPLLRLVCLAVTAGLLVRGTVGLAWALGVGEGAGETFDRLNTLLYTPLCLGFAVAAARVAGVGSRLGARLGARVGGRLDARRAGRRAGRGGGRGGERIGKPKRAVGSPR
ncbi:DUF3995 domain-containing protein [Streptomyces sp. NPDC053431]|uniref:DUF3995 domain-containing protein n=1 Tax=Streptomyces sp. NPDC053431 TaxID=3365703 RepID=UPI0037D3CE55